MAPSSSASTPGVSSPSLVDYLKGKDETHLDTLVDSFAGPSWTRNFISSLPVRLPSTSAHNLPSSALIAKNLKVLDLTGNPDARLSLGLQDIRSISFDIQAANGATLEWTFSLKTNSAPEQLASTYRVLLDHIHITIERPAYFERTFRGTYGGKFEGHTVRGEFTPTLYRDAMVYKTTFLDRFPMVNLLAIFFCTDFHFSESGRLDINVPGLEVLKQFAAQIPSLGTSFVVEIMGTNSFLTQVSGGFPFEGISLGPNWGILKNASLFVNSLRIVLSCINSSVDYQIAFELGGKLNPSIPFCLSTGLWELKPFFELAILPGSTDGLSIRRLLELTGSSEILNVTSCFPVSNLSNDLAISNATVGWVGLDINFLGLGLVVEAWKIVDKFEIGNLSLNIYSTSPFHFHQFALWGSGLIKISDLDFEVFFNVQLPAVDFKITTLGRPLTLQSLFGHFFKENGPSFPIGFHSILEQIGIDSTTVEGSHGSNGWSLSRFAITMGIDHQLDIFKNFRLSSPCLAIDITHPFDEAGRSVQALIDAAITLTEDTNCGVSIDLTHATTGQTAKDSVTVMFVADGALSLKALLDVFGIQNTSSHMPTNMVFLLGIGLTSASASLSHSDGKYSLSSMSASVVSSRPLLLWDHVELKDLSLDFNYPMSSGVKFSADLSFEDSDLQVVLTYTGSPSQLPPQVPSQTSGNKSIAMTASGSAVWSGKIEYDGMISVPAIITRLSGIKIKDDLSSAASGLTLLPGLYRFDFEMSNVIIGFEHRSSLTSVTFEAETKFLVVQSVCLECSKANSWGYSLKFNLSNMNFLSLPGVKTLSLTAPVITLSNRIDNSSFPVSTAIGTGGLTLSLSVTLKLDGPLGKFKTYAPSIDIRGTFSATSLGLYVELGTVTLFHSVTLSGWIGIAYANDLLQFSITGDIQNIFIKDLSSKTFTAGFSLSFDVGISPEIVLTFQLSRLENAFTIHSLDFENIQFGIGFSEEFPVPSYLTVAGQVQFCVDDDSFAGAVALYINIDDLSDCHGMGSFYFCPTFTQALGGFRGATLPDLSNVDGTFADLSFRIAPQGFKIGKYQVPPGYKLAGSLNLPSCGFDASFDIEIDIPPAFLIHVDGYIKNALVFPESGSRLFALSRASSSSVGPSISMTITMDSFNCDVSAEVYLLGISASFSAKISDNGLEINESISGYGDGAWLNLIANDRLFWFSMSYNLSLSFPAFWIGNTKMPPIDVVQFTAVFSTGVIWSKAIWKLKVTGDIQLMWWYLGTHTFTLDANFSDLEKIGNWIANEIEQLYKSALMKRIEQMLNESLDEVLQFLSFMGMEAIDIGKLLVKYFGYDVVLVVKGLFDVLEIGIDVLIPIMKELGMVYSEVLFIVLQWGCDILSVAGVIANTFELTIAQVIEDATHIDIQLPQIQFPRIQLPRIQLPRIQLPTIQLPTIHFPSIHL